MHTTPRLLRGVHAGPSPHTAGAVPGCGRQHAYILTVSPSAADTETLPLCAASWALRGPEQHPWPLPTRHQGHPQCDSTDVSVTARKDGARRVWR